ncbi:unnamed protein product [Parascedosporium putredinis]|uniref:Methyltransferase n=1 Tax=Parascedosporium putredinis TaxID=1442378 RepID=A0A9P1GWX8_9PEZI|nr:unnamed protein product [Parascedosporium putredinis]CAI7989294.1 unnamed protein product [Parascedosporium putredinis]
MAIQSSSRALRGDTTAQIAFFSPTDGTTPYNLVRAPKPNEPPQLLRRPPTRPHPRHPRRRNHPHPRPRLRPRRLPPVPSTERTFTDDASIRANVYPEIEALLLANVPGSEKVVIFDHTVRRTGPAAHRSPVLRAHIDQTPRAAEARVRRHLDPDEAETRLQRGDRYRIINVWRPLNAGPVESFPLAFASSATLRDDDVVPVRHIYDTFEGETAAIAHHPDQRWLYLGAMGPDEALLLQCFDSDALREGTKVRGGRLAHTAFEHPGSLPDAEGRESIEIRALVFGP